MLQTLELPQSHQRISKLHLVNISAFWGETEFCWISWGFNQPCCWCIPSMAKTCENIIYPTPSSNQTLRSPKFPNVKEPHHILVVKWHVQRVNHIQTNGKWAKVKPMPSKTTNRVWVHWCPSFGLAQITYSRFFYDSKLFLVINKLNQLKHNFYWTSIIYCTIRYILILNTSPFDMGKKDGTCKTGNHH